MENWKGRKANMDKTVNNRNMKKILSLVLALVLTLGFFALDSTKAVAAPSTTASTKNVTAGSTIYFGSYPQVDLGVNTPGAAYDPSEYLHITHESAEGSQYEVWRRYFKIEPIAWKVVENKNGELLLVADNILDVSIYDESGSTDWETSDIREWLNTLNETPPDDSALPEAQKLSADEKAFWYTSFYDNAFKSGEKPGIKATTLPNGGNLGNPTTDNVFLLDKNTIANTLPSVLGGVSAQNSEYVFRYEHRTGGFGVVNTPSDLIDEWMGLPVISSIGFTTVVDRLSNITDNKGTVIRRNGVRPAIKLDLNNVVMVSQIGGKASTIGLEIPSPLSGDLKLTVASSALGLTVNKLNDVALASVAIADSATGLKVEYSGASTGAGTYLSAILEKDNVIQYYGKVKDLTAAADSAGTATIALSTVPEGNYTLKLFAEKEGAGKETDFASAITRVSLAITTVPPEAPQFTTASLPDGSKTVAYSEDIVATGTPNPELSLKAGETLPPGLTFNENGDTDNKVKGTPTAGGTYTFTLVAAGLDNTGAAVNIEKSYTIVISDTNPPTMPTLPAGATEVVLPDGTTGVSYYHKIETGALPDVTFALENGTLPAGLTLNSDGSITGIPTTIDEVKEFELKATNIHGSDTQTFKITINDPNAQMLPVIKTVQTEISDAAGGLTYSQTIVAEGYPIPSLTLVSQSTIPAWLELVDNGDGTGTLQNIAGQTAPAGASEKITIRAEHTYKGETKSDVKSFTIKIAAAPVLPTIQAETLGDALVGTNYDHTFILAGAPSPTISLTGGELPAGMAIDSLTKKSITGTPTASGIFTFEITATSVAGSVAQSFTINVNEAVKILNPNVSEGKEGTAYAYGIAFSGYPAPTFSVLSGNLPTGLTLSSAGIVSGTPTAAGSYTFTIEASNGIAGLNAVEIITMIIKDKDGGTVVPPKGDNPAVSYSPSPMNYDLNSGPKSGTVGITLGMSTTGLPVADSATITTSGNAVSLSSNSITADGNINVTAVNVGSDVITITFLDTAGNPLSEHTKTIAVTVTKSSTIIPGGNTGSGGGNSGGGSVGGSTLDKSPHLSSGSGTSGKTINIETLWDRVVKSVPSAITTAKKDDRTTAIIRVNDGRVLTVVRAKQIRELASKNGGTVVINADIISGKAVLVRITLDTEKVDADIKLGVEVNSKVKAKFEKSFKNNIATITFENQDKISQTAKIAARLDLTELDTDNLVLYSYNAKTNKYSKLVDQNYRIDKNGYLHFETELLLDIVVSDGALASK